MFSPPRRPAWPLCLVLLAACGRGESDGEGDDRENRDPARWQARVTEGSSAPARPPSPADQVVEASIDAVGDTSTGGGSQAPAPTAEPLSAEAIEAALAEASDVMKELGAYRRPRTSPRGPTTPELDAAYDEGRAMNWQGSSREIQLWSSLAKFGRVDPDDLLSRGPLAGWDLHVITRDKVDIVFLHAVLPSTGPHPEGGTHVRLDGEVRWVALCDRARPGVDYTPYKRDGTVSLHHQWGREDFVDDLVAIARDYRRETGVPLGIGDISHVTGGKLKGHWTHRLGVDADLYVLTYPERDGTRLGPPVNYVFSLRRGEEIWSTRPRGRGDREPPRADGSSQTAARLELLAKLALRNDAIAFFVHDAASILAPFDALAQARRAGRRYLHLDNHGYWPDHPDHVHVRWAPLERQLPTGTPRP